jgi:hypothetical protein
MTARTSESVELLEKIPRRAFVEVGAFDSHPGGDVSVQLLLRDQRDEAAKRGCDGLLWNWTPETATLHATCLVYRDSGPGPAPMLKTNGPL